jgi:hypothetical protein
MDVHLEIKTSDDIEVLKEAFRFHGPTVKSLEWGYWSSFDLKEDDILEMLNFFPNLEGLELRSWFVDFSKSESSAEKLLNLPKLRKLSVSTDKSFFMTLLGESLPENVIEELKIDDESISEEVLESFFEKQSLIKSLDIDGSELTSAAVFHKLQLAQLRCIISDNDTPEIQYDFLLALVRLQPLLKDLDLLSYSGFCMSFVDDEMLEEISKIQAIESLKMSINGISARSISNIQKLRSLKNLEIEVGSLNSLETMNELSLMKLPVENLYLKLWTFEIPQQTYRQFGENFKLKSLKITLGTWHPITFFIESFPTLESLSIRFTRT